MKFYVNRVGWGFEIEADYEAARWLAEFLRKRTITPADEAVAVELHNQLMNALGR